MNLKSGKSRIASVLILVTAPLLLAGCNNDISRTPENIQASASSFVFEETEHDFGVIKQSGGIVQHDFRFTYQGNETITISSTPGSCACTTGEVDKKELKKGDSATLTVFFHPNLHAEPEGRFSKTVSIMTDPPIKPVPEVTVWQEIDLDLGEEAFELSQMNPNEPSSRTDMGHSHGPEDHGRIDEIGHDGSVTTLQRTSKVREFTLTAQEVNSELDEGMNYLYWTYDGVVPGPFLRAQVGDTIKVTLKNPSSNHMPHSIDLHAVNGPGGGATDVHPGEQKTFQFKALNPGVYIYHCGTREVAEHITNGAYGLILIEPMEGFEPVDKEYYLVQGEFYSVLDRGQKGSTQLSGKKLKAEQPEFIVFNGRVGSLTSERALRASVGDRIRLFVGNGGVSKVSSFHVIGEIFDLIYPEGGTPVQHDIQTTVIPAGGAVIVEFTVDVPGTYKIVDHALARLAKGAIAELVVDGDEVPKIFHQGE